MVRRTIRHGRLLALLALFGGISGISRPTFARYLDPLADATEALQSIEAENKRLNYRTAATLTLTFVKSLRADAQAAASADERASYISWACTALDTMLAARRCADVIAERTAMRKAGLCSTPETERDATIETCEDPSTAGPATAPSDVKEPVTASGVNDTAPKVNVTTPTVNVTGPKAHDPETAPIFIRPDVDKPEPRSRLQRTAIATGVLGGAALVSTVVMAAVAARKDPTDCTPFVGSYCKIHMAASVAPDVPHSENDHLCSGTAPGSDRQLAQACEERQRLIVATYATAAIGSALGLTAIATGVFDHLKRKKKRQDAERRPGTAVSLRPVIGPSMMLQTTVRF